MRKRLADLGRPLTVPAYRRLWSAQVISELGDWAARLALSVLVFERTGSAGLAGLATAVSLVPWLGPGQLLTSLSERWPRRRVLVVSDLLRAGTFGLAALPLPIPVLLAVVFVAGLATPPFEAARSALRPEVLPAPLFGHGVALSSITEDLTVACGYVLGGGLVALLGAPTALLVNAGTYALSALLLARLPAGRAARAPHERGGLRLAARALRSDVLVRRSVVLVTGAMLSGTALIAMSAPFVLDVLGRGAGVVGVLVALTSVVSILVTAFLPIHRDPPTLLRWAAILAFLGGGGVVCCFALTAAVPAQWQLATSGLAFLSAGLLFTVLAPANVIVGPRLPAQVRASAFALLMGLLVATEAAGATVAGAVATAVDLLPVVLGVGVPALVVGAGALLLPVRAEPVERAVQSGADSVPTEPAPVPRPVA